MLNTVNTLNTNNKSLFRVKYWNMTTEQLTSRYIQLTELVNKQFKKHRTMVFEDMQLQVLYREMDWILKTLEARGEVREIEEAR